MGKIIIERKQGGAETPSGEVRSDPAWDQVTLALGKGNAVGPEFLQEMDEALDQLEPSDLNGPAVPIVLTGQGSVFSAGLDLPTLVDMSRDQLTVFLQRFDAVFARFALLPRPVVAAVNGHAVAGGAILLLACDRRLGSTHVATTGKSYRIGLREAALGLALPRVAWAIVEGALGTGSMTREVLYSGDLYDPQRGCELGYLDAVVAPESLISEAETIARRFAGTTARAAADLKRACTARVAQALEAPLDSDHFLDQWFSPEAQQRLRAVVASLRS